MLNISIDNELAAKLREAGQAATVRDADGRLLGVFRCMTPQAAELYQQALDTVDPEELQRLANDDGPRYTTREVVDYLKSLEPQACDSQ